MLKPLGRLCDRGSGCDLGFKVQLERWGCQSRSSKDLGEVLHTFPIVIVAGFLSVRHKEQIKISLSSLWLSDAKRKNVSSRKEESHSPTQEHVGSSKANLWWRCGNCKLLLWKQNHCYCILLVSFSRLFPSFHLFLIFSRKLLEG